MRTRPEILLLLLLCGGLILAQHAKFPAWFFYAVMLLVLATSRLLAPEWFKPGGFATFWWVCVGVAGVGLLLEVSTLGAV